MKNILMRILLALIFIPLLIVSIVYIEHYNHIAMAIIFLFASIASTYELTKIFKKIGINISLTLSLLNAAIIPILFWLTDNKDLPAILNIPPNLRDAVFILIVLISLTTEIINSNEKEFKQTISNLSANIMLLFYPILLTTYIIRLGTLELSPYIFFIFFTLVFINDTFAYTIGMLFGKKSWKPFPVSPNKSIVGYIGGILATILVAGASYYIKPDIYNDSFLNALYLGALISVSANTGDLVESSIKRAAGVKDSGKMMLGRGGVLDTIDSLLFSAPVMYYFFKYILK